MKKSRMLTGVLTMAMILGMSTTAFAKGNIYVDLVEAKGASPQIVNDRTMVPVRAITEMLGYKVNWIQEKQQVEVCDPKTNVPVIIMNINNTRAYYTKYEPLLGESVGVEKILDSPATLINDRTYVPLRFISEAVGYTVDYNVDTADVYLFSPAYMGSHEGEGKGETPSGVWDDGIGEDRPSGVWDDGIGEDRPSGVWDDGIGEDRPSGVWDDGIGEDRPSGVWDDGIGEDNPSGVWDDGIGDVVPLSYEEMLYVCDQTTNSWLAMSQEEKDNFVTLIGRWWEERDNLIVEDYDEMVAMLDHQCEQYYRYGVDEYILYTVCDLYGVDVANYATMG